MKKSRIYIFEFSERTWFMDNFFAKKKLAGFFQKRSTKSTCDFRRVKKYFAPIFLGVFHREKKKNTPMEDEEKE